MIVFASQHVYGSVHSDESPRKKEGYQTLFYTNAGITSEEVRFLEQHAQCTPNPDHYKHQFFLLPSGKAVITQITTLPDLDAKGVPLFLSHAMVISSDDFLQLAYSPLGLFTPDHFFHRIEEAYTEGDLETGDIPQKKLVSQSGWEDAALRNAQEWEPEHLVRLVRFGWQAKLLSDHKKPVVFSGSTEDVLNALAIVFLLTLPEKRRHLTFDTYMDGCSYGDRWPFWAWGASPEQAARATYRADTGAMQTVGDLSGQHDSPIERWISERSIPSRLVNYIAELDQTQLLNEMLAGQALRRDILINLNEEIVQGFTEMNPEAVVRLVQASLPPGLSPKLMERIRADVRSDPAEYAKWASSGLVLEDQADYLFHLLLSNVKEEIASGDRKLLENLAAEAEHTGLYSLISLLARDFKRWDRSLEYLPMESYRLIVQAVQAQNLLPARDILYPPYLEAWASQICQPLKSGELKNILGDLNHYRGQFDADHLLPLLKHLSPSDREQLSGWLQSYSGPAPLLRAELSAEGDGKGGKFRNPFARG